MRYIIEETKTEVGKRKILIIEDVARMFQAIIEDGEPPKMEKVIDGHTGFLFYDDGNPLVAMYWQHRFNRMVGGITIFTGFRYRTSRLMFAAALIAPTWQNRE